MSKAVKTICPEIVESCTICKREIMYESPDNFEPVCMNEYGDVHCEECCTCGDICPECEHLLQGADECPTCSASDHLGDGEETYE
tara:strand:+ start:534 stop:788 length:255 start_codon:yes stop_codon:yes gene_type:complete